MKTACTIILFHVLLSSIGQADIIYDFDFEPPDFTVDTQITNGPGLMADGNVFVRTGIADFSTQVASLEPAGGLSFGVTQSLTSGIVSISWDMALVVFGAPLGNTLSFGVGSNSEGGGLFGASYNSDGTIHDVYDVSLGIGYALGVQNHFQLLIDLDTDSLDFLVDGGVVVDNASISPTISPEAIVFSRGYLKSPQYAIDNFRWEVIPEPTSLILILFGGFPIYCTRRRKQNRI